MKWWHEFWYEYHKRSAQHFHARFFAGWGDEADANKGDAHLKKAIYHRKQSEEPWEI